MNVEQVFDLLRQEVQVDCYLTSDEIKKKFDSLKFLVSTIERRCSKFGKKCQDDVAKAEMEVARVEKEKDNLRREANVLTKELKQCKKENIILKGKVNDNRLKYLSEQPSIVSSTKTNKLSGIKLIDPHFKIPKKNNRGQKRKHSESEPSTASKSARFEEFKRLPTAAEEPCSSQSTGSRFVNHPGNRQH